MKTVILIIALAFVTSLSEAQKKAGKTEQAFQKTLELIESNQFEVEADRAYPAGGRSVDLFSNRGYITINDSIAKGSLPFFGRGYSIPFGEGGGIQFDNRMEKRSIEINDKKKNKFILYRFTVKGKNDVFDVSLQISSNGSCTVSVSSNQRSQISYNGEVSAPKKSKAEEQNQ